MKIKVSQLKPSLESSSTDNYLVFIPPDDPPCPDNADIINVEDVISTIEFLFTEANTKAPLYEELSEEGSERSQSEDEETEQSDDDVNVFVYQSLSLLISQGEEDWDGDDGLEWLRRITFCEISKLFYFKT